jgi:hypothetical protein
VASVALKANTSVRSSSGGFSAGPCVLMRESRSAVGGFFARTERPLGAEIAEIFCPCRRADSAARRIDPGDTRDEEIRVTQIETMMIDAAASVWRSARTI